MRSIAVIAILFILLVAIIAGNKLLINRNTSSDHVQILVTSNPYPPYAAQGKLIISITDANGNPIPNAVVQASVDMHHAGMLPYSNEVMTYRDDHYEMPILWSMAGEYMINVTAQIPGETEPISEQFETYAYTVPMDNVAQHWFDNAKDQNSGMIEVGKELRILIPQGTRALYVSGQGDDIIPEEIYIDLDKHNTLVIVNNDLFDHSVGPFYVKAGETIRQTFTKPAVYQGTCTIRHGAEVNIIVE